MLRKWFKPLFLMGILLSVGLSGQLFPISGQTSLEVIEDITLEPERIDHFFTWIDVQPDGSLKISERIEYVPPYAKHGIFRYVPIRYQQDGWVVRRPISEVAVGLAADSSPFELTEMTKQPLATWFEPEAEHPFSRSVDDNGNLLLKIGDPDATFFQPRTYLLSYRVENAVQRIDDRYDLLWDITGDGWPFPILNSTALVTGPKASQLAEAGCFGGRYGSDDQLCQIQILTETEKSQLGLDPAQPAALTTYDQTIRYGSNLTVGLLFEPEPGGWDLASDRWGWLWWLRDNGLILLTPLPALIMLAWWWLRGRDEVYLVEPIEPKPEAGKPTRHLRLFEWRRAPFVYQPISTLTPGQAGVLLDERVDNKDVVAELLDLARQRYLKIEAIYKNDRAKRRGKADDYVFTLLKPADSLLPDHQQYLLNKLFSGKKTTRTLSKMKGKFYTAFEGTKKRLYKSVKKAGWFAGNPQTSRLWGIISAIVLYCLSSAGVIIHTAWSENPFWLLLWLGLSPLAFLAGWHLPRRTAFGRTMTDRSRGLQKSIRYGKWREEIKEKRLFIDEVLPFAVATGVVSQLAKDMKDLSLAEPDYVSGLTATGLNHHFSSTLADFSRQSASNLSYNPSSSSSSSGGFSGGGFSGGGGGGGGGGSW